MWRIHCIIHNQLSVNIVEPGSPAGFTLSCFHGLRDEFKTDTFRGEGGICDLSKGLVHIQSLSMRKEFYLFLSHSLYRIRSCIRSEYTKKTERRLSFSISALWEDVMMSPHGAETSTWASWCLMSDEEGSGA